MAKAPTPISVPAPGDDALAGSAGPAKGTESVDWAPAVALRNEETVDSVALDELRMLLAWLDGKRMLT
jgi:hypothetical protein